MIVNICGLDHIIKEVEDKFDATELHFGMIDHKKCEILINKNMTDSNKKETICHEILHGILMRLGYNELNNDEQFVNCISNAISQTFDIRYKEQNNEKR